MKKLLFPFIFILLFYVPLNINKKINFYDVLISLFNYEINNLENLLILIFEEDNFIFSSNNSFILSSELILISSSIFAFFLLLLPKIIPFQEFLSSHFVRSPPLII